jgi:hypothetical protein
MLSSCSAAPSTLPQPCRWLCAPLCQGLSQGGSHTAEDKQPCRGIRTAAGQGRAAGRIDSAALLLALTNHPQAGCLCLCQTLMLHGSHRGTWCESAPLPACALVLQVPLLPPVPHTHAHAAVQAAGFENPCSSVQYTIATRGLVLQATLGPHPLRFPPSHLCCEQQWPQLIHGGAQQRDRASGSGQCHSLGQQKQREHAVDIRLSRSVLWARGGTSSKLVLQSHAEMCSCC